MTGTRPALTSFQDGWGGGGGGDEGGCVESVSERELGFLGVSPITGAIRSCATKNRTEQIHFSKTSGTGNKLEVIGYEVCVRQDH